MERYRGILCHLDDKGAIPPFGGRIKGGLMFINPCSIPTQNANCFPIENTTNLRMLVEIMIQLTEKHREDFLSKQWSHMAMQPHGLMVTQPPSHAAKRSMARQLCFHVLL